MKKKTRKTAKLCFSVKNDMKNNYAISLKVLFFLCSKVYGIRKNFGVDKKWN